LQGNPRHIFVKGDVGDRKLVSELLATHKRSRRTQFCYGIARQSLDPWSGGFLA